MDFFPYQFEAELGERDFGKFAYVALFIPPHIVDALKLEENPRLRVRCEIAGKPHEGALQPFDGRYFMPRLM